MVHSWWIVGMGLVGIIPAYVCACQGLFYNDAATEVASHGIITGVGVLEGSTALAGL